MPLLQLIKFTSGLFLLLPVFNQDVAGSQLPPRATALVELQDEVEIEDLSFDDSRSKRSLIGNVKQKTDRISNELLDWFFADETSTSKDPHSSPESFVWPAPNAARITGFSSIEKQGLDEQLDEPLDLARQRNGKRVSHSSKGNENEPTTKSIARPSSEVIVEVESKESALSPEMIQRQGRIESCLKYYYTKPVNADVLRPWSILHGVLGYGQNSLVASQGVRISAVDYLCQNGVGNDRRLLMVNNGKLSVAVGVGFQGHEGQLLAILAQVQTPIDHPIQINGQSFTVRDLVEYEKSTCRAGTELTFKLIGLSVYLSSDEIWKDNTGQKWDISRLMFEEMAQPINGAACGGIHRLMGLSYALTMRRVRGETVDGQWKRAETFLAGYHKQVLSLQNSDGGFSTEFFEGKSSSSDPLRQIYSTGHCLEWLTISMTEEQLVSSSVTRMVDKLLSLMEAEYRPGQDLNGTDVGPKGHALRALRLYELRVFGESSNHLALAAEDRRPVIGAQEIPAIQLNHRTILATSTEGPSTSQTGSQKINTGQTPPNMPNTRGNRLMRRR